MGALPVPSIPVEMRTPKDYAVRAVTRDLPLEDWIDLHTFRPSDTAAVVQSYLDAALEAGYEEVRIVHGRGTGVQREIVRSLLARHPNVADFRDAPPERGGWGATLVRLGKHPGEPRWIPNGAGNQDPEPGAPWVAVLLLSATVLLSLGVLAFAVWRLLER